MRRQCQVRRHEGPFGRHDCQPVLLGGLGDGFQRHPKPAVARQRDPGERKVDDVLHVRRDEHRDLDALENAVGLVWEHGGVGRVVVAGDGQHAAKTRGADGVGAAEGVAAAVHAGAFAVPHAEHAIDALAGEGVDLLAAPHHRGREVLVQSRLEADVCRSEQLLPAPQLLVDPAERRAAIARDQPCRSKPGCPVKPRLLQQRPHQRLHA